MSIFTKNNKNHSSFWMDNTFGDSVFKTSGKDHVKLASSLKAIGNFVKIVTSDEIAVKYNNKDESYTDGKTVTISSKVNGKSFDSTVGLALHEGSHCLLSDFQLLKKVMNYSFGIDFLRNTYKFDITDKMIKKGLNVITLKDILNYIEDRRIDLHIYKTAPGYQPYYKAMYDRYFHSKAIDKGLKSGEYREENLQSYLFRIINLTNINRDLDALKGLRKIYNTIDFNNITRLKSTEDCLKLAIKIMEILDEVIPNPEDSNCDDPGNCDDNQDENKEGSNCSNGNSSGNCKTPEGNETDDGSTSTGSNVNQTTPNNFEPLSNQQKEKLRKAIQKQKEFIRNQIKKSTINSKDKKKIDAINKADASFKNVGSSVEQWSSSNGKGVDCLIVKDCTKQLALTDSFDTFQNHYYTDDTQENVDKGIMLGTQLGRKLQVRNESRDLKYNRLNKGKIDKRLIASAGFGNENLFSQVFTSKHKDCNVHLSVDASGSMSGTKWNKSITAVVAIAKAASMVGNLNIQISFRSTESQGKYLTPAIFIAYDSRKDKFTKIQNTFKYFRCPGTTPEGLCFEAIQNIIQNGSNNLDSYFINFSDGEPYFDTKGYTYWGPSAAQHTKKEVENMRNKGIKILSYFISEREDKELSRDFKIMYGSDSANVSVNSLLPLAKTLNKMFIEKK